MLLQFQLSRVRLIAKMPAAVEVEFVLVAVAVAKQVVEEAEQGQVDGNIGISRAEATAADVIEHGSSATYIIGAF